MVVVICVAGYWYWDLYHQKLEREVECLIPAMEAFRDNEADRNANAAAAVSHSDDALAKKALKKAKAQ